MEYPHLTLILLKKNNQKSLKKHRDVQIKITYQHFIMLFF